jgi:hypothetical protein
MTQTVNFVILKITQNKELDLFAEKIRISHMITIPDQLFNLMLIADNLSYEFNLSKGVYQIVENNEYMDFLIKSNRLTNFVVKQGTNGKLYSSSLTTIINKDYIRYNHFAVSFKGETLKLKITDEQKFGILKNIIHPEMYETITELLNIRINEKLLNYYGHKKSKLTNR